MPYYPLKEKRLYMTLEEVNTILKNYFDRWFKADVKYDEVEWLLLRTNMSCLQR